MPASVLAGRRSFGVDRRREGARFGAASLQAGSRPPATCAAASSGWPHLPLRPATARQVAGRPARRTSTSPILDPSTGRRTRRGTEIDPGWVLGRVDRAGAGPTRSRCSPSALVAPPSRARPPRPSSGSGGTRSPSSVAARRLATRGGRPRPRPARPRRAAPRPRTLGRRRRRPRMARRAGSARGRSAARRRAGTSPSSGTERLRPGPRPRRALGVRPAGRRRRLAPRRPRTATLERLRDRARAARPDPAGLPLGRADPLGPRPRRPTRRRAGRPAAPDPDRRGPVPLRRPVRRARRDRPRGAADPRERPAHASARRAPAAEHATQDRFLQALAAIRPRRVARELGRSGGPRTGAPSPGSPPPGSSGPVPVAEPDGPATPATTRRRPSRLGDPPTLVLPLAIRAGRWPRSSSGATARRRPASPTRRSTVAAGLGGLGRAGRRPARPRAAARGRSSAAHRDRVDRRGSRGSATPSSTPWPSSPPGPGHELNNPLAVIVGRAQLLLARERPTPRRSGRSGHPRPGPAGPSDPPRPDVRRPPARARGPGPASPTEIVRRLPPRPPGRGRGRGRSGSSAETRRRRAAVLGRPRRARPPRRDPAPQRPRGDPPGAGPGPVHRQGRRRSGGRFSDSGRGSAPPRGRTCSTLLLRPPGRPGPRPGPAPRRPDRLAGRRRAPLALGPRPGDDLPGPPSRWPNLPIPSPTGTPSLAGAAGPSASSPKNQALRVRNHRVGDRVAVAAEEGHVERLVVVPVVPFQPPPPATPGHSTWAG